jgi:hypothetical protein
MFGSRMVPSFWPITSFLVGWWDQGLQTKSCRNLEVTLILGLDNPSGVILCTGTLLSCYLWFGISWDWRGTYFCELDHILFVRKAEGLRFAKFVCVRFCWNSSIRVLISLLMKHVAVARHFSRYVHIASAAVELRFPRCNCAALVWRWDLQAESLCLEKGIGRDPLFAY